MKISTKSRYAVMAMMELALHGREGSLNLNEISKIQGISISYLEQLFAKLRQHGLVKGRRGPGGGYQLAMAPEDITISDIICAVSPATPAGGNQADDDDRYHAAELWDSLSHRIYTFLNGITLAQSVAAPGQRPAESESRYPQELKKHTA